MPVINDVFSQIGLMLFIASVIGIVAIRLKQPLIVGFIAVGILLGPSGFGWVEANDQIDLLAKLGITLLLFIVGLKLDLHIIKTMGLVALATGIGQVLFTSIFGYLIALSLDFNQLESIYIAVALTFSSTIIIVKLLSDKREVDSLHGRIAVGFLIVQDIMVIIAMIGLNAISGAEVNGKIGPNVIQIAIHGFLFLLVVGLLMRFVLSPLLEFLAQSRELLLIFSIAWAVSLGALGHQLGFSKEVGAFVAGVSLASTPFRDVIGAKLVGLRDFLLLFFFVDLGAALNLSVIGDQIFAAAIFSVFVLIGNPLIVMVIMGLMGYRKRTGFLAGLTVAQISEFSLILAALGVSLGHVKEPVLGLVTLVGLVTISASTYMILYSHKFYNILAPWLSIFERSVNSESDLDALSQEAKRADLVVFGLGRFGKTIAQTFKKSGYSVLGIDFDLERVRVANSEGVLAHYGDAEDSELFETLPLKHAQWVVGAIHDKSVTEALALQLRAINFTGRAAFAMKDDSEASEVIKSMGSVFIPYKNSAEYAAQILLTKQEKE